MTPEQMRVQLSMWKLTHHAQEQMAERGVALSELVDAILNPVNEHVGEDLRFVRWGKSVGVAWKPIDDDAAKKKMKLITTVYLMNSSKDTWQDEAAEKAQSRKPDLDINTLLAAFEVEEPRQFMALPQKFRPEKRSGPVETRNIFDGIPPSMMAAAREMLRAAGHDPNDLSRVRRIPGKNGIEIIT